MAGALEPVPEPSSPVDDIVEAITAALAQVAALGREALVSGGAILRDAVDGTLRDRVEQSMERGDVGTTVQGLAMALSPPSSTMVQKGIQMAGSRAMRRVVPLRFAARRSPVGLALTVGPAVVSVVRSTVRELDVIAAHLAARARFHDHEPDAHRVTIVAVQAVAGAPLDPDTTVPYERLVRQWFKAGAREVLPWGGGRSNEQLADLVGRVADFDVARLAADRP